MNYYLAFTSCVFAVFAMNMKANSNDPATKFWLAFFTKAFFGGLFTWALILLAHSV